tara:strand:+ start:7181 stop:10177 length:2997 start_codon:yes stop_codon:yes gene_type:complete
MGRFDKVFDILNKFGEKEETDIYGGDLPEKIERMGNKVVVPESKDNIDAILNIFVPKGKSKGMKFGKLGDIFDKNFDALDNQLVNIVGKPGDLLQNLKAMNAELFEEARRGTKTLQEIAQDAGKIGFNNISHKLMLRKPGDMLKPEEVFGGLLILQKLDQELMYGIDKLQGKLNVGETLTGDINPNAFSDKEILEDYAKIQRLIEMSKTLSAQLSGGVSEFGRGLGLVSKLEQVLDVDFRTIDEKFDNLAQTTVDDIIGQNGRNKIVYELQVLSALDFRARQDYVQNAPIKKGVDIIMEMYINALLSSPTTHTVNIAGNAVFQGTRFLETGLAGVIGNTRQFIKKNMGLKVNAEDQTMLIESHAFMHGSLMAQKDAFKLMLKTAITGESGDITAKFGKIDLERIGIGPKTKFDKDGNITVQTTNNIVEVMEQASRGELGGAFLNTMGIATRLPGRFLAMEDEYFKVMIKKRVQYQEAYRASAIEIQKRVQAGFSLEEAQEYGTAIYHQVLTNPSKEVRERMTQIALKETFQSPTGEAWSKAFSHPLVKFLGVPFYKTPTNIIKEIGDRTLNFYPTVKALREGKGREFDEAFAKLVTGWGVMTTMTALVSGYYGDDIIITGTGPGDAKARDIINKGANIPPTSIGIKQEDGSYEFISFNRFDPISMLLIATADYVNFAEYHPNSHWTEKLSNSLTMAITEYAQTAPFLQGIAELQNIAFDRFETGDSRGTRLLTWLGSRTAGVASNVGGQAETFTSLGGGSLLRKLGVDYPFIGSNSLMATLERISDPTKSNTMLAPDQITGFRIEEVSPFWKAFYETMNQARSRSSFFSKELPSDVNFWGEPVYQLDPNKLQKLGKVGSAFNPFRIQNGKYTPLDKELMRLSIGGAGTFNYHGRSQGGYRLFNEEYLRYVQLVNNIDDNGNMPEDQGYNVKQTLLNKLTSFMEPGTKENEIYFLAPNDEEKYELFNDVLSNKRSLARDNLFKSNQRLIDLKNVDMMTQ